MAAIAFDGTYAAEGELSNLSLHARWDGMPRRFSDGKSFGPGRAHRILALFLPAFFVLAGQ